MNIESFGLPSCLHLPIAVESVDLLEARVGRVVARRISRQGRINAVLIESHPAPSLTPGVGLWEHPRAEEWRARLHPVRQVWVHVDYHGYRGAWRALGMPDPGAEFLDHIANRRAIRMRRYAHPYLRLCPVSHQVNTSGGSAHGGEGLECDFISHLEDYSAGIQEELWKANAAPMLLADPMDLTKMLNLPPGAVTLDGVRDIQGLFYPAT